MAASLRRMCTFCTKPQGQAQVCAAQLDEMHASQATHCLILHERKKKKGNRLVSVNESKLRTD